ncbi:MAG TPA: hypothetical protein VKE98_14190, partial [Gemmataceae bacterium]|nr:hypothetical protein [Gemmataceae bacterium]
GLLDPVAVMTACGDDAEALRDMCRAFGTYLPVRVTEVGDAVRAQDAPRLLRAEGLHSCPQMAWSQVRKTVAEIVSPPPELILFCGMSIGYEDFTVPYIRTGRAPLHETVTFVQGSSGTDRAAGITSNLREQFNVQNEK